MAAIKLKNSYNFDPMGFSDFLKDRLPKYSIPVFIRVQKELEFTATLKLRKINLRKQGYDVNNIQDPIYVWDVVAQSYDLLDVAEYSRILDGKFKI
jgi:hypothetical protein